MQDPVLSNLALQLLPRETDSVTQASRTSVGVEVRPAAMPSKSTLVHAKKAKRRCEASDCVTCFLPHAEYKWNKCRHQSEGIALLCRCCRKAILECELKRLGKHADGFVDYYKIELPCIICRTPGVLKKHRFQDELIEISANNGTVATR